MIISQKDDAKIVRIVRQAKLCWGYVHFGFLVVSSRKMAVLSSKNAIFDV